MRLSARSLSTASILVLAFAATAPVLAQPAAKVAVTLELAQQFYYVGQPLEMRVSVRNLTDQTIGNPVKTPLLDGFKVRSRDGSTVERTGTTQAVEPTRPDKLSPGSFYGAVLDIADLYPGLREPGAYQIYWSGNGIVSEMLIVTVIPQYDPEAAYRGRIDTEHGSISMQFYPDQAPIAVKSFIDMANAGFYDGLEIHEVHADDYIVAGDPRFAKPPRRSITFPAEQSTLPLVAGTVVLKPVGAAPPANGSTFVILLKPQPAWTGQVTVLGQVTRGMDVVQKISRLPSSMRSAQPFFRPLEPVVIRKLTISEAAEPVTAP